MCFLPVDARSGFDPCAFLLDVAAAANVAEDIARPAPALVIEDADDE